MSVDIEYCEQCGYKMKYEELLHFLNQADPNITINGHEGRRGAFEVTVNGVVVHSKLSTLAYPDFEDLGNVIKEAKSGKPIRTCKQQPITGCVVS